jgi:uncharacterized DUF497 family protein
MFFEWDERKAACNLSKHGVAFDHVVLFEFELAVETIDDRWDYGETRMIAYAPLNGSLHALVYTRRDDRIRVISLRRANERERLAYEKRTTQ